MENDSFQLIKEKLSRVPVSCYATLREIQVDCYALQVIIDAQSQENKPKAFFGFGAHSGLGKFSRETEDLAKKHIWDIHHQGHEQTKVSNAKYNKATSKQRKKLAFREGGDKYGGSSGNLIKRLNENNKIK